MRASIPEVTASAGATPTLMVIGNFTAFQHRDVVAKLAAQALGKLYRCRVGCPRQHDGGDGLQHPVASCVRTVFPRKIDAGAMVSTVQTKTRQKC
jgi:hypothetical protein